MNAVDDTAVRLRTRLIYTPACPARIVAFRPREISDDAAAGRSRPALFSPACLARAATLLSGPERGLHSIEPAPGGGMTLRFCGGGMLHICGDGSTALGLPQQCRDYAGPQHRGYVFRNPYDAPWRTRTRAMRQRIAELGGVAAARAEAEAEFLRYWPDGQLAPRPAPVPKPSGTAAERFEAMLERGAAGMRAHLDLLDAAGLRCVDVRPPIPDRRRVPRE